MHDAVLEIDDNTDIAPLEFSLGRGPTHSFFGLGGASPSRVCLNSTHLVEYEDKLLQGFSAQLDTSNVFGEAEAKELEETLCAVSYKILATLCDAKALEVGDSVLASHNYAFLSSFSTRGGTEFKDTRAFRLYRSLATQTPSPSKSSRGRLVDKPSLIYYAEVPENGDMWSVVEGPNEVAMGPWSEQMDHWLDLHAFGVARETGREQAALANLTLAGSIKYYPPTHRGASVPIGIARALGAVDYAQRRAQAERVYRNFMARTSIAHAVFHLLAANEMCGAVYGSAVVGYKLVRLYILGPSRIAIELDPPKAATSQSKAPHERSAIHYTELETAGCFDRIPLPLVVRRDSEPDPILNRHGLQAYVNLTAASYLRLGAANCTQALTPLPTPIQDAAVSEMADVLHALTPLPPELCHRIVQLSLDAPLSRGDEIYLIDDDHSQSRKRRADAEPVEGIERASPRPRSPTWTGSALFSDEPVTTGHSEPDVYPPQLPKPTSVPPRPSAIDWDALDEAVGGLAMFVPVTTREMDGLVAAQLEGDLAAYASVDDEVPLRTLLDDYDDNSDDDSSSGSDIDMSPYSGVNCTRPDCVDYCVEC